MVALQERFECLKLKGGGGLGGLFTLPPWILCWCLSSRHLDFWISSLQDTQLSPHFPLCEWWTRSSSWVFVSCGSSPTSFVGMRSCLESSQIHTAHMLAVRLSSSCRFLQVRFMTWCCCAVWKACWGHLRCFFLCFGPYILTNTSGSFPRSKIFSFSLKVATDNFSPQNFQAVSLLPPLTQRQQDHFPFP